MDKFPCDLIPLKIRAPLGGVDRKLLNEIRLRAGRAVKISYGGGNYYLGARGLSPVKDNPVTVTAEELGELVLDFCERSVYAYADKLQCGFVTLKNGVRVGICGECVTDGGKITGVKNVSSVNVRIPHAVKGCSEPVLSKYVRGVENTLIVSPPGAGKTTMARDLAESISERFSKNVLVCDERNEIFPLMSAADSIDCIRYGGKKYAFENGIRAMAPDVIVTDEIVGKEDALAIYRASRCGVKVIATAHGDSVEDFTEREEFSALRGVFGVYVLLDDSRGKGTIKRIAGAEYDA